MNLLDELLVKDFNSLSWEFHYYDKTLERAMAYGYFIGRGRSPTEARELAEKAVQLIKS